METSRLELWDAFLARWPVSAIERMTIDEYGDQSSGDSFTYWVERKLRRLGSILGSTSFKFGVYKCAKKENKPGMGHSFDASYGWKTSLGRTADEAFARVKESILCQAR